MPDIDFQKIELNLIPKKGDEPVIFYASQYETARPFIADLMWGESEFEPGDDCYAEIDIRKNDDNLVVITDDVAIDNNEVSVVLPVQALTCIGKNLGQVKIYASDDHLVAALNFILEVQADPLAGGVTSETAIDNLESQIDEIISGEGYLKSDDVAPVALSGSYNDLTDKPTIPDELSELADVELTSPEMNNSLFYDEAAQKWKNYAGLKYTSFQSYMTNYYNNSQVDTLLAAKADASDVYTKAQVDSIIDSMLPIGTASGNPCTFDTEIAAALQALTADIVCGGGGGTPSTPVPLVGHSELNLDVNGNTFTVAFGQTVYGGVYDKSGRLTITWAGVDMGSLTWEVIEYQGISYKVSNSIASTVKAPTASSETANIKCSIFKNVSRDELDNYNFVICIDPNKNIDIIDNDYSTASDFTNAMSGIILAYELATPIVIDVDAISPSAIAGTNTITSDCIGDVSVSYKDTIQHYIDERT